jgi:hypothetical protein
MSIFARLVSRIKVFAGRRKPKLDFELASLYVERQGTVVDYSVWFSQYAIEALEAKAAAQDKHFADEKTVRDLMDGKWVRRDCQSRHAAIQFNRHLKESCYPNLIALLSSIRE